MGSVLLGTVHVGGSACAGFNLREALADVKSLMEGNEEGASWEERCVGLYRHYQALARDYKRSEKRLVECQKKQLEVGVVWSVAISNVLLLFR